MTKRDFFILIIKVFGLLSMVTSLFSMLPSTVSFAITSMELDAVSILWIVVAIVVVIGLFVALIYKADKVVRLLKLDKGFDDDKIELGSLKAIDILKIGSFIIGGFLILDNIPVFLSHSYFALKGDNIGLEYGTQDKFNWAVSGLNLIIGFLLFRNYDLIARILKTKDKR